MIFPQIYIWKEELIRNIYTSWLPKIEDDPRVRKSKKKRREVESSTGVDDPIIAALIAKSLGKTNQMNYTRMSSQK